MINAIIQGIFKIIMWLFDLLFSPILSGIFALFPGLSSYFTHITTFLNMCFTYVRSILSLILINDTMITALFDYFIILYSIYLIVLAIRFIINVYNKTQNIILTPYIFNLL